MSQQKIVFANQLRGVAALLVVIGHLLGVYWTQGGYIMDATASQEPYTPTPQIIYWISTQWWGPGPMGVGIFFLISGFVIPISLARQTAGHFAKARVLRIWPTYLVAVALEMALVYASSLQTHATITAADGSIIPAEARPFLQYVAKDFPFTLDQILRNLLLIHTATGVPSIDFVNDTLAIEIKFYILCALLAPWIRAGKAWLTLAVPAIAMALAFLVFPYVDQPFLKHMAVELNKVGFMFIGMLFYFHFAGRISGARLSVTTAIIAGMFLLSWTQVEQQTWIYAPINYIHAIGIFSLCYLARQYFRPIRIVDWFAAISYPLYLVHSVVGYLLMNHLRTDLGFGRLEALAASTAGVLLTAWALHMTVERWSIRMGKPRKPKPLAEATTPAVVGRAEAAVAA